MFTTLSGPENAALDAFAAKSGVRADVALEMVERGFDAPSDAAALAGLCRYFGG
jgi:hypothetical protein